MKTFSLSKTLLFCFLLVSFFTLPLFSPVLASSLLLNPPFGNVEEGKDLSLDIVLKAKNELVDGVDILLTFDVNVLKVKEVKNGAFFREYPIRKEDSGQLKITALSPKEGLLVPDEVVVSSVIFEILDTGETKVNLSFVNGSTTDSNVTLHATSVDSLTEVKNGNYSVVATPEKVAQAKQKKAQTGLDPLPFFLLIVILGGVGGWYYLKKRKPKEEVFVPEPFPLDRPPKVE